jgi:GGDEF domain-containing protein
MLHGESVDREIAVNILVLAGRHETALFVLAGIIVTALAAYFVTVLRTLRRREEHSRREQAERARTLSLHDSETMLRNRPSFQQEAVNFIQRCSRNRTRFDLFYGALRVEGDDTQAMKVVAGRLQQLARPQDFLARYGRFEFALLRMREPMEDAPSLLRDQLLAACTLPMEIDGQRIQPQAHVGCGTFPDDVRSPRQLLMAAARTANIPADARLPKTRKLRHIAA